MVLTLCLMLAGNLCGQTAGITSATEELLSDPSFARGFTLTAASHPVPKVETGSLQMPTVSERRPPAWRFAQWGTTELLRPGVFADCGGGKWCAENRVKRLVVDRSEPERTVISIEGRGALEYDGRMRAAGEAWPHLLVEQRFAQPIVPKEYETMPFSMEARIPSCQAASWSDGKRNPALHTAQVSAYWTVHNATKGNADYGEMIWFGIPFFDARYDIPPAYYAIDAGKSDASGKFICLLDGRRFWNSPTGDGAWHRLDADLAVLLREAVTLCRQHGYLNNTAYEDLAVTTFNLGWEIAGPYDASLDVRGLAMRGQRK